MVKYVRIKADMTAALKNGDKLRRTTLADMVAAIDKAATAGKTRAQITDALVDETLAKYQKMAQEMVDTCPDTEKYAERKAEYLTKLEIVKEYAPQLLTDYAEVKEAIMAILSEYGPVDCLSAKSNRGTVMKILAPALKGKADMSVVNRVLNEVLV